jgi:hypothetical protein
MRFEGAFTNLLNHPNFPPPPTNVTASSFGIAQSVGSSPADSTPLTVRYEFRLELPKIYYRPESRNIFELPSRVTVISNFPEPQP